MRRSGLLIACSGVVLLAGCAGTTAGTAAAPVVGSSGAGLASATVSSAMTSERTTAATSAPEPTTAASSPDAEPGTVVTTADSQFGDILFDDTGQAIYLFDRETSATADCYDECADAWPPVLTDGAPVADGSVASAGLATTIRTDGTVQVTYFDHPLYYYAYEGKHEVTCHNVDEFGGLWLVVTPTGDAAAH